MTISVVTQNSTAVNAVADNVYSGAEDVGIKENSPTTNFSFSFFQEITKYAVNDHSHLLMIFPGLLNIPPTDTINSATLYIKQFASGATYDVALRRMLQGWGRTTCTWNTYDGVTGWNTPGALGAGTDRVSTPESVTSVGPDSDTYYALPCTSLVQDIIDGTIAVDEGFHLERNDVGNDNQGKSFFSSATGSDGNMPELVVDHSAASSDIDIDTGPYPYSGSDISFTGSLTLDIDTGLYDYTGYPVDLWVSSAPVDSGSYPYSGNDVDFDFEIGISIYSGAYPYFGNFVNFAYDSGNRLGSSVLCELSVGGGSVSCHVSPWGGFVICEIE